MKKVKKHWVSWTRPNSIRSDSRGLPIIMIHEFTGEFAMVLLSGSIWISTWQPRCERRAFDQLCFLREALRFPRKHWRRAQKSRCLEKSGCGRRLEWTRRNSYYEYITFFDVITYTWCGHAFRSKAFSVRSMNRPSFVSELYALILFSYAA